MQKDVREYYRTLSAADRKICGALHELIVASLPKAENKVWHRHPVWFLDGNPVVGYDALKDCVRLFFWSGQTFEEKDLVASGSFKAAEKRYTSTDEIKPRDVKRWLKKAQSIQWDYKNIIKRKGRLVRIDV